MVAILAPLGVAGLALAAAWEDYRYQRISNALPATLAVGWVAVAAVAPTLLSGPVLTGVLCGVITLAAGLGLRATGWLGGGDVKMAAALGLWLGPVDFGLALVAGGALTILLAGWAFALGGDVTRRGVPLACALVPPAAALLLLRAFELAAPTAAT